MDKKNGKSLSEYLNENIFNNTKCEECQPEAKDVEGFDAFIEKYKRGIAVERAAVENL